MQTLPPTAHDTTSTRATSPRRWLLLAALLVFSQVLNVWIISRAIAGDFGGWVQMFDRAPLAAPPANASALSPHVSVALLASPPAPDPAR